MKQETNFLHFNSRYCHYFQKIANALFKKYTNVHTHTPSHT